MDFDHVRGEKSFGINVGLKLNYPVEDMMKELEKCDVVCANCHRERTHNRI